MCIVIVRRQHTEYIKVDIDDSNAEGFSLYRIAPVLDKADFLPLIGVFMEETALNIVVRTSSSVLTRKTSLISGSSNLFLCFDVKLGSSVYSIQRKSYRQ